MMPSNRKEIEIRIQQNEEDDLISEIGDEKNLLNIGMSPSQAVNRDAIGKFSQYFSIGQETVHEIENITRDDGMSSLNDIS